MRIEILGVPIDAVTNKQAMSWIIYTVRTAERPYFVTTPNPEMVVLAQKDKIFLESLKKADLSVPDGTGLLWAARLQGQPLPERVPGVDLVMSICRWASETRYGIYLLGGDPTVAEKTASVLRVLYPSLKISGTSSGGQVIKDASGKWTLPEEVWIELERTKPDILFVAFGHGKQEGWIMDNLDRMPWLKIAIGIGGSFDFISGKVKRAPIFFRKIGLEWLWRLIIQPSRWRRIFRAVIVFPFLVIKAKK